MLRSYLTIAWRNVRNRAGLTFINVVGLAVGLAACLLIGLWIERELSFDAFHPEADRVHRITVDAQVLDNAIHTPMVPAAIRGALLRDVPEVEAVTRLRPYFQSNVIRRGNQAFATDDIWRADSTFFDVFGGFELLRGDRSTALDDTDAVILTASTARRIFNSIDVVGEPLEVGADTRRVTGVVADVPETSHLQFDSWAELYSGGKGGLAPAHVGLVVAVAGLFKAAAFLVGKIEREGFGHGGRQLHIRNTRVKCNRFLFPMLPD